MAFAGASAAVLGMPNWTYAQSKAVFDSVNVFVPAAPGGGWDGLARSIEVASKSTGLVNTFQFENVILLWFVCLFLTHKTHPEYCTS